MIEDVIVKPLTKYVDERGWLAEVFRVDELALNDIPKMSYISLTRPNVTRGPHEHIYQTDIFLFLGDFLLTLWDNRSSEPKDKWEINVKENTLVVVPPRIVHCYKNISGKDALVINYPNQLFKGEHKKQPIDEIRHENVKDSRFKI